MLSHEAGSGSMERSWMLEMIAAVRVKNPIHLSYGPIRIPTEAVYGYLSCELRCSMDALTPSFVSVSKNFLVLIHKMGPIVFTLPVLMVSLENKKILKHLVSDQTPSKFRIL